MPADLSSWIAKARGVIARATPGPRWESLGGVLFSGDTCIGSISLNGKGHVYNLSDGDLIVLAVNSLPALLDAVEAGDKVRRAHAACSDEEHACDADVDNFHAAMGQLHVALDAAKGGGR